MNQIPKEVSRIMKMVDHSLLAPGLTDQELKAGCELALKYQTASVCVKPCHVKLAAEILTGSDVLVGGVIGFPHGNSALEIKLLETRQILEDGAVEVDMVVNLGKVLGKDWDFVRNEIKQIADLVHQYEAVLKVIFENDLLPDQQYKIRLCEICSEVGADFVKTSTGYNYIKGSEGCYSYQGATLEDLQLMLDHTSGQVQVKAAGKSGTLERVLLLQEMGVTRTGTGQTEQLYRDAMARFA